MERLNIKISEYGTAEEIASSITHGLGLAFGIVVLTLMVVKSSMLNDVAKITSSSIYGGSIIFLFLSSTLYHSITHQKTKYVFKILDHCAIYVLIAGSYTPFLLVTLKGPFGIFFLVLIWSIAIVGIIFKALFIGRFNKIGVLSYLVMGWLSIFLLYKLGLALQTNGLILLGVGGLVYSVGTIFYMLDKKLPFNHSIWHLFVLGGCVVHFVSIYCYVL